MCLLPIYSKNLGSFKNEGHHDAREYEVVRDVKDAKACSHFKSVCDGTMTKEYKVVLRNEIMGSETMYIARKVRSVNA